MKELNCPKSILQLLDIQESCEQLLRQMTTEQIIEMRRRIAAGETDGRQYYPFDDIRAGECFCFVGNYIDLTLQPEKLTQWVVYKAIQNSPIPLRVTECPINDFFYGEVRGGDTPKNSEAVALVVGWIDAYLVNLEAKANAT